jgi:hypothetical protein
MFIFGKQKHQALFCLRKLAKKTPWAHRVGPKGPRVPTDFTETISMNFANIGTLN